MTDRWPPFTNLARYGGGARLEVVDLTYWDTYARVPGTPGTGGAATNTLTLSTDPVSPDEYWLLQWLYMDLTSQVVARMDLYEGDDAALPQQRRDWAPVPYLHPLARPYHPGKLIRSNMPVTVAVTGLLPGDQLRLALEYAVVKKVSK